MKRDSFIFYRSFKDAISDLPNNEKLAVYDAIAEYALNYTEPELTGIAKTIWKLIKPQLEANWRRFQNGCKGKEHGVKGGNPNFAKGKSNPYYPKDNPDITPKITPKITPNVNDNVNDNDNVNNNNISSNEDLSTCVDENGQEKKIIVDYHRIIATWKECCPGFPQPRTLADDDKMKVRQRFNEMVAGDDPETAYQRIKGIFTKIGASDFCKAGKWCSFRWVFKNATNWRKVEDGNYDNNQDSGDKVNDIWK